MENRQGHVRSRRSTLVKRRSGLAVISGANDRCLGRCLPPGGTLIRQKWWICLINVWLVCERRSRIMVDVGPSLWRIEPRRWGVHRREELGSAEGALERSVAKRCMCSGLLQAAAGSQQITAEPLIIRWCDTSTDWVHRKKRKITYFKYFKIPIKFICLFWLNNLYCNLVCNLLH